MVLSLSLGIAFEKIKGSHWNTTVSLVVSPASEKETTDFNYDHYYSLEAIDSLTDSLEEWLKSPGVKNQIKSETKADFRSADWRFFENNNWSVRKYAPQLVEISFSTNTSSSAKEVDKVLRNKVSGFLASFDRMKEPHFDLTNSSSDVDFGAPAWSLVISLSLLWGLIFGIILHLLLLPPKKEEKKMI